MIEMNWNPGDRQLRQFGVAGLVALPLAGWLWHASQPAMLLLTSTGIALAVAGAVYPKALKPLFVGLSLITLPIGLVMGELMLAACYALLFVPLAIVFRLIGRDALQRSIDRAAPSYWQPKAQPATSARYFRQS